MKGFLVIIIVLFCACEKASAQLELSNTVAETLKFVEELASVRFASCSVIRFQNGKYKADGYVTGRKIPILLVNLNLGHRNISRLGSKDDRLSIRYHAKCILYHVLMATVSPKINQGLIQYFALANIEIQNHDSFLLFETTDNLVTKGIRQLVLDPGLKKYEHKAIVETNFNEETTRFQYHCSSFCYFCKNGDPDVFSLGVFNTGVLSGVELLFPDVTSNFHGREMKITAAPAKPFVSISKSPGRRHRLEGMQGVIAYAIAHQLNFTIDVGDTSRGLTGLKLPNGTWKGSVAEVLYGRSDIGLNTAVSYDRFHAADFTVPATYGFLVLVATKPSPFFEWQAIFYPFEIKAWLCICSSIFLTIIAYKFLLNHGSKIDHSGKRVSAGEATNKRVQTAARRWVKVHVSFLKSCYITVGSMLDQGVPFRFSTHASRVYALFWFMFAMVATCAYKSKLFSFLTFPVIMIPPTNFHELGNSDYTWGLQSLGGLALLFITTSPVAYIRRVGEKMETITDPYRCLDRTFTEKFVCINYKATFDYMSAVRYWQINHRFHVSDYVAPPVGSSWVLPKNSPLVHPLNKIIQGQFETGLGQIYADEYIKETALKSRALAQASAHANDLFEINTNYHEDVQREKPLEFVNLYASFLVLFFGSAIAAGTLVAERIRFSGVDRKRLNSIKAKMDYWGEDLRNIAEHFCTKDVILGRSFRSRSRASWTRLSCAGADIEI